MLLGYCGFHVVSDGLGLGCPFVGRLALADTPERLQVATPGSGIGEILGLRSYVNKL